MPNYILLSNGNFINEDELYHWGVKGQKWGVRRYQNPDGTLTAAGRKRAARADKRWIKKKSDKITRSAEKKVSKEMNRYLRELASNPDAYNKNGRLNAATINAYNRRKAALMNEQVSDIRSPSGKVVSFVAKRGEAGVMMALSDQGYNMDQLRNGVYTSGKVAYRSTVLNKHEA